MIEAEKLSKRYEDGVLGLDSLDLKVEPGQIYCLLGANGAGKTTAINLFMNFLTPTSGTARINGIDANREPLAAKRHVAYLSETVTLYPNFTAHQNLEFFARLAHGRHVERAESYELLGRVGLPEKAFEGRVKTFSKGMRQKLGIAIAMVKQAPALLLDEPMSGLDPKAASELVATLNGLRDEGRAILMSTHDIFRAKAMADVVGIMKGGHRVAERSRSELEHENLERLYLDYMQAEAAADAEASPSEKPGGP